MPLKARVYGGFSFVTILWQVGFKECDKLWQSNFYLFFHYFIRFYCVFYCI